MGRLRVVQSREITRDLPHGVIDVVAPSDAQAQPPVRRHPAHHHDVVARIAIRPDHVGDPEVHVRCETPIEFDLAMGSLAPEATVEKSRKPRSTGFLIFQARSPMNTRTAVCVSVRAAGSLIVRGWDQSPW